MDIGHFLHFGRSRRGLGTKLGLFLEICVIELALEEVELPQRLKIDPVEVVLFSDAFHLGFKEVSMSEKDHSHCAGALKIDLSERVEQSIDEKQEISC